jgi:hypothetical protein
MSVRSVLIKDALVVFLLGWVALYWAEPHWLLRTTHTMQWAGLFNRSLMDALMGAPSRGSYYSIPGWMPIIGLVTLLLTVWRWMHRLGF